MNDSRLLGEGLPASLEACLKKYVEGYTARKRQVIHSYTILLTETFQSPFKCRPVRIDSRRLKPTQASFTESRSLLAATVRSLCSCRVTLLVARTRHPCATLHLRHIAVDWYAYRRKTTLPNLNILTTIKIRLGMLRNIYKHWQLVCTREQTYI